MHRLQHCFLAYLIYLPYRSCPVLTNPPVCGCSILYLWSCIVFWYNAADRKKTPPGVSFAVTVWILFTISATAGGSHRCKQAICLCKKPPADHANPLASPLLFVSLLTFLYTAFLPRCLSLCQHWEPRPRHACVISTEILPRCFTRCLFFAKKKKKSAAVPVNGQACSCVLYAEILYVSFSGIEVYWPWHTLLPLVDLLIKGRTLRSWYPHMPTHTQRKKQQCSVTSIPSPSLCLPWLRIPFSPKHNRKHSHTHAVTPLLLPLTLTHYICLFLSLLPLSHCPFCFGKRMGRVTRTKLTDVFLTKNVSSLFRVR